MATGDHKAPMTFGEAMAKSNELMSEALLAIGTAQAREKMRAHLDFNPYLYLHSQDQLTYENGP